MSVPEITDATFETEVLQSKLPVFIDLWAPWCGPCVNLTPIVDSLSQTFQDKIKFVKANIDENPAIREAFQVQSIPLMAVLKGNSVVDTALGLRPKVELTAWLEDILENLAKPVEEAKS